MSDDFSAAESVTDLKLLQGCAHGDEKALQQLHGRYANAVFSFILARITDRGTAEEVSADVWLGCWRSASAFRGDSQVLTWLLGIAKRQIWARIRVNYVPTSPLDDAVYSMHSDDPDPAVLVVEADAIETLVKALDSLPSSLAEVVRLAWLHELPYDEIASVIGIPSGTVKSRISRARRLLREQLGRKND